MAERGSPGNPEALAMPKPRPASLQAPRLPHAPGSQGRVHSLEAHGVLAEGLAPLLLAGLRHLEALGEPELAMLPPALA